MARVGRVGYVEGSWLTRRDGLGFGWEWGREVMDLVGLGLVHRLIILPLYLEFK